MHRGDQRGFILQKIVAGGEEQRLPRVVERQPYRVDRERIPWLADDALGFQWLPNPRTAAGKTGRRFDGRVTCRHFAESLLRVADQHLGQSLGLTRGDVEVNPFAGHAERGPLAKRTHPNCLGVVGELCRGRINQRSSHVVVGYDEAGNRCLGGANFKRARKERLSADFAGPGRLENGSVSHCVVECHPFAVPIQSAILGPVPGQGAAPVRAWIVPLGPMRPPNGVAVDKNHVALRVRPTRQAVTIGLHIQKSPGPGGVVPEQLGVEAHGRLLLVADLDRDALIDTASRGEDGRGEERSDLGVRPASVDPVRLDLIHYGLHRSRGWRLFFRLAKRTHRLAKRQDSH